MKILSHNLIRMKFKNLQNQAKILIKKIVKLLIKKIFKIKI